MKVKVSFFILRIHPTSAEYCAAARLAYTLVAGRVCSLSPLLRLSLPLFLLRSSYLVFGRSLPRVRHVSPMFPQSVRSYHSSLREFILA
mmetsp:Transcript_20211/g.32568  ORF Transcript_20211/g.32568 Transcript_20211/m.32568 type:complete len:89 (+) Transcript_20211:40-306(+)